MVPDDGIILDWCLRGSYGFGSALRLAFAIALVLLEFPDGHAARIALPPYLLSLTRGWLQNHPSPCVINANRPTYTGGDADLDNYSGSTMEPINSTTPVRLSRIATKNG
jgi:hypothetical protein